MSSILIPKEQETAYERWEMASFPDRRQKGTDVPAQKNTAGNPEQIALVMENARKEGYVTGMRAGYAAGLEQGAEAVAAQEQKILGLTTAFSAALEQADEAIAEELVALAMDIAKAMLKTTLKAQPERILELVKAAIHELPASQQHVTFFLHPEDATIVKQLAAEDIAKGGWRIATDPHIERGGCRVETASNQVDATLSARWQRIAEALGQPGGWLAP
ncbi:MAG: flagellar assembly protein FliH [Methylophilaceae bacterium]